MNNFHALLAQVIPVLLLAAAFESRVLQRIPMRYGAWKDPEEPVDARVGRSTNFFQSIGMVMLVAFIGAGEAIAIWCVYTGQHEPWQNALVLLAGLTTLAIVIGPLVSLHYRDYKQTITMQGTDWSTWMIIVVYILMGLFIAWYAIGVVAVLVPTAPA